MVRTGSRAAMVKTPMSTVGNKWIVGSAQRVWELELSVIIFSNSTVTSQAPFCHENEFAELETRTNTQLF